MMMTMIMPEPGDVQAVPNGWCDAVLPGASCKTTTITITITIAQR